MRFTMKNEIQLLYGYVLDNFKLLDNYEAKKINKSEL